MTGAKRFASRYVRMVSLALAVVLASLMLCWPAAERAYASDVRYIAVFGADTWVTASSGPACDLGLIARVDTKKGTVSFLTIPRDMQYTWAISKKELGFNDENAPLETFNSIFRYQFKKTINDEWNSDSREGLHSGNYAEALHAASKKTCKMMTKITGIKVTDYVVVDLYTYGDIVEKLMNRIKVDMPAPIKDYRLYSDGSLHTVNKGKYGLATFSGDDAVVASRARVPYESFRFNDLSKYKGTAPQLFLKSKEGEYYMVPDATRQFVNRRALASLIDKALDKGDKAWTFAWNTLVNKDYMWTNMSKSDFKSIGNALVKAKKDNKLVVYGSQIIPPYHGGYRTINGLEQWMYLMNDYPDMKKKLKAAVKDFKAGKYMSSGYFSETIIGVKPGERVKVKGVTYEVLDNANALVVKIPSKKGFKVPNTVKLNGKNYNVVALKKGQTKKADGVTYKALDSSTVSVVKIPNKKSVAIPSSVLLNGKKFKVTTVASKSMKGNKVRAVTLGANTAKIAANAFNGSKATTLVLKTTKLTKSSVKGSLAKSVVKTIKVSVPKAQKAAVTKKYTKIFAKSNSKCKDGLVVV